MLAPFQGPAEIAGEVVLFPLGGMEARGAKLAHKIVTNADIVESVAARAAKVSFGRTARNAGEYVNVIFDNGMVMNIRLETHPPLGLHGNLEVWQNGVRLFNKHIR
jgi:hypothetical protein